MTPIHHHFELLGWSEPKIVYTFWAFSLVMAVIGVMGLVCYRIRVVFNEER